MSDGLSERMSAASTPSAGSPDVRRSPEMRSHRGSAGAGASSDAGAGASFYVELPVAGGKLKAIAPGELADGDGAAGVGGADEPGRGQRDAIGVR